MMKITGLSHLFKWENLHNWWLTKYFFAPLYTCFSHIHLDITKCKDKYTTFFNKLKCASVAGTMKHAVFKKNKRAYNTLKNKGSLLASMIHEEHLTSMEQHGSLEWKKVI